MVDFVYADRCKADGRGDFVAPDLGAGVALLRVAEHTWDDAVAVEGLTVGEVGGRRSGVGGGIVPAALGELLFGQVLELAGVLELYQLCCTEAEGADGLHTSIERRHFAVVAPPEVLALVLGPLRRGAVLHVGVLGVHGRCCQMRISK